jgi:hypothetical protein
VAECPYCTQEVPEGDRFCPLCRAELPTQPDTVYELSETDTEDVPTAWQGAAVYTLEAAARCPHCREPIRTVRVVRMRRTQVPFTSTLPRGGRVITCSQCERIISVELTTLRSG